MKNQSGSADIKPEDFKHQRLYTQDEVDILLKSGEDSLSPQDRETKEIREENQSADKQKRADDRTVANLVKRSNRILISIRSHALPFDFFPDIITVEDGRLTIINRHFFSSEVHSVDIKDIANVFINRNFLFAQLVVISKTFEDNEVRMKSLYPKEAILVRRIIEGLRVFVNKQIDTSTYTKEALIAKLQELSTTKIVT